MSGVLNAIVVRKSEHRVVLECVGDGAIVSDVVTCVLEKGVKFSPRTIVYKINTLIKYGVLKSVRMGKYVIVKSALKRRKRKT